MNKKEYKRISYIEKLMNPNFEMGIEDEEGILDSDISDVKDKLKITRELFEKENNT